MKKIPSMIKTLLLILTLGLGVLHTAAFADIFECADDGHCHDNVATEGDVGIAGDESLCGPETLKKAPDQSCHVFSPCGADEGKDPSPSDVCK